MHDLKFKIMAIAVIWLPLPGLFLPIDLFPEGDIPWYYPWSNVWFFGALFFYYPVNQIIQLFAQHLLELSADPIWAVRCGAMVQSSLLTALAFRWMEKKRAEKYPSDPSLSDPENARR